jgi:hypothetical protein
MVTRATQRKAAIKTRATVSVIVTELIPFKSASVGLSLLFVHGCCAAAAATVSIREGKVVVVIVP